MLEQRGALEIGLGMRARGFDQRLAAGVVAAQVRALRASRWSANQTRGSCVARRLRARTDHGSDTRVLRRTLPRPWLCGRPASSSSASRKRSAAVMSPHRVELIGRSRRCGAHHVGGPARAASARCAGGGAAARILRALRRRPPRTGRARRCTQPWAALCATRSGSVRVRGRVLDGTRKPSCSALHSA